MSDTSNSTDSNTNSNTDTDAPALTVVIERIFAAPVATVFKAWTDPVLLARWYKPNSKCETAVLAHDLQPGGVMLYQMKFGQMPPHHERWVFAVIDGPHHLQFRQTMADADGNVVGNARMPDWPRTLLSTVELSDHPEGTLQRFTWQPHDATDVEKACFAKAAAGPQQGWAGGFTNLNELLEAL